MELVRVGEDDTVILTDSSYLSTRILKGVPEDRARLYVCFATNSAGGFNYQSAQLTVTEVGSDTSSLAGIRDDH